MGFFDNYLAEKRAREYETFLIKTLSSKHKEFGIENPKDVKIIPVDGDKSRMVNYGLYAGDKIVIKGKEIVIEQDERERMTFLHGGKTGFVFGFPGDGDVAIHNGLKYSTSVRYWEGENYQNGEIRSFSEKSISVTCPEKTKPITNLRVLDKIHFSTVTSVNFRDNKNIYHIAHFPERLISEGALKGVSITELPDNLKAMEKLPRVSVGRYGYQYIETTPNHLAYHLGAYGAVKDKAEVIDVEMRQWDDVIEAKNKDIDQKVETLQTTKSYLTTAKAAKNEIQNFMEGKPSSIQGFRPAFIVRNGEPKKVNIFMIDGLPHEYSTKAHELVPLSAKECERLKFGPINNSAKYKMLRGVINRIEADIESIRQDIEAQKVGIQESKKELSDFIGEKRKEITEQVEAALATYEQERSVAAEILSGETTPSQTESGDKETREDKDNKGTNGKDENNVDTDDIGY